MIKATANNDGSVSLTAEQGTTWRLSFKAFKDSARTVPYSLEGKSLRGQMRKDYVKTSKVVIEFMMSVAAYHPTDNPDNNIAYLFVHPDTSSAVSILTGFYDIEVFDPLDDSDVLRLVEGSITISPEITRVSP